jgi:acetyltransferase-like isoleucine patch superfamily enzyme
VPPGSPAQSIGTPRTLISGRATSRVYARPAGVWEAFAVSELSGWRLWWVKRRWYERNRRPIRRLRINRHMARAGAFVRWPIEGEVLEGLESGRLTVGEATLFEPGCWLTLGPGAEIRIGSGCFLNRNTMLAAVERVEIGDHVMFANGCFVGDADHRYDDPETPITQQGFVPRGPVRIGSNVWFGVNCVVTGGVEIGARAVIGANSVVTKDIPAGAIAAGAPAKVIREIEFRSASGD